MPKAYNKFGDNAKGANGIGFLAEQVHGECLQITPNGLVETAGFKVNSEFTDSPPNEANLYHRPWYGQVGKQPSDKGE